MDGPGLWANMRFSRCPTPFWWASCCGLGCVGGSWMGGWPTFLRRITWRRSCARASQSAAHREMRRVLRSGGRVVIVDLQQPRSFARAITAALSLITLLHSLSPSTSRFDVLDFEPLMTELGFEDITQHSFGSGAIGTLVGRLGSGASVSTLNA